MNRHLAIVPWITALAATTSAAVGGDGGLEHSKTYSPDLERPLVLVSAAEMLGTEVENRGGEMFGELCDLVVDRCTGRALFAIVGGNGVLGLTDMKIAVPYEELTWRSDDGKFHCDLAPDRLRTMEIYCPNRLQQLGCSETSAEAPAKRADPHAAFFAGREPVPADGAIVAVLGWNHDDSPGSQVAVAVRLRAGDEQRFLLGPPEFLEKGLGAPLGAGQHIALEAVQASDDVGPLWVAKTARVEGGIVRLRDDDGQPLWEERPHVLVTDLAKCVVVAGGSAADKPEQIGGVEDIVLDARTGQLVFVTVLVADEWRAIPMRALSLAADDELALAKVSKDAFQGCPRLLGDEIAELNDPTLRAGIYSFFGVDPARVLPR